MLNRKEWVLVGAWKLHLLELSGSKSSRTTSLQNIRVWKVGKNKYLQGRTQNSVREKCGKWQNWEILPYLKIPKKISDRFSLKNVYVSVLVFSVNSKNLNIGCTARFGEIKQEKNSYCDLRWEDHCACLFWENTGFQRARAPTVEYVNDKQSNICLKKKFVQRVSPAKKIPAQGEGEKKNRASWKSPSPPPSLF